MIHEPGILKRFEPETGTDFTKVVTSDVEGSGGSLQSEASFHSQVGLSNDAMSRKLMIFSIWLKEKNISFWSYNRNS